MGGDLVCPYDKCGKEFKQPLLLSGATQLTQEVYYACPHCHSKLDLVLTDTKNLRSVQAVASADADALICTQEKPQSCPHFVGYLKTLPEESPLPEKCLACPKVVLCFVRH